MKEDRRTPYYAGKEFARMNQHDGALRYAVGASNYQVMRANRSHPEYAEDAGYTYNHAPMLTYWKGYFYLEYLCNRVSEHTGNGMSFISRSADGISWEKPKVSFPVVKVPAGSYHCADGTVVEVPEDKEAFMHQRMGFYQAPSGRLLVSGFYGHAPHHDICPWENYGMGRAVREVYEDGSMGPVYFIRYLDYSGWTEDRLPFPYYKRSADAGFVAACEALLADRLVTQQWAEEHGDRDPLITLKTSQARQEEKAGGLCPNSPFGEYASSFCWYHVGEKTIMALWKQGKVGRSDDGGLTWIVREEPTFATSGAKSWGQKTGDGKYAIAYDNSVSSEHRYPLVVVTSEDGIRFDDMACVFGEVPPRRYEGTYKDFGPQYIRGIPEGEQRPEDAVWLCHSVNKEDIFVSRIPVPVVREVREHVNDDFSGCEDGYIKSWNVYSPLWAPVRAFRLHDGTACMRMADRDPCDYAKAVRVFPAGGRACVSLDFMAAGGYDQDLEIELTDGTGVVACRVLIGGGKVRVRHASNVVPAFPLSPEVRWHTLQIRVDCAANVYEVSLDGEAQAARGLPRIVHKVNDVERLVIRTKPFRYLPNTEIYPLTPDMQGVDEPVDERVYYITNVKTGTLNAGE
jgi:hypothetical protein